MAKLNISVFLLVNLCFVFALAEGNRSQSIRFGAYYSMADSIELSGSVAGTPISETDKSSGKFGVSVEKPFLPKGMFYWVVGLSFDFERTITEFKSTQGSGSYLIKPTISFGTAYLNSYVNAGNADFYLGMNYSTITIEDSNYAPTGNWGYQLGALFELKDKQYLFVEFRALRGLMGGTRNGVPVDYSLVALNGMSIGYKTSFF